MSGGPPTSLALARLLQLASPVLPVGAYTYSQGLEWAVDSGIVRDEASAGIWIGGLLEHGVGTFEAPLLAALHSAWSAGDSAAAGRLNEIFLASREAAELRAETVQMGYSLRRLLHELGGSGDLPGEALDAIDEIAFPTVWAAVAVAWRIEPRAALTAYLWSWCENQTMAALKTVPLGQATGQRLLLGLGSRVGVVVERALALPEDEWSNFAPGFAIACCRHETQYSRLFRS